MHYDALMQEAPSALQQSTVRAIFGGIESIDIPILGLNGVNGTHLDLQLSTLSFQTIIPFGVPGQNTVAQLQSALQVALSTIDPRIVVRQIPNRAGTLVRLRIDAPFPITVLNTSTSPLYAVGQTNKAPTGTLGASLVTPQTYKVERSLQYLDIKPNDFLCIDGGAYRIARIIDDPSDQFYFQRVTLLDALPVPTGTTWTISGTATSADLDFWNGLCEVSDIATFEVVNLTTMALTEITGPVLGASSVLTSNLPVDATAVGVYLAQPKVYAVYLKGVLRRRFIPLDPLVVDVPRLQEFIVSKDDTQVLRRNVDYFFDTFRGHSCLRFITPVPSNAGGPDVWQGGAPPPQLWAETSYLDNRPVIEQNFGLPAAFTLDDLALLPKNVDYLSSVQGLWYAYFNGPTVFNIRAGTQILLGLPFAEQTGIIVEIRSDFGATTGRMLVQDAADSTVVREYIYPSTLSLETNPVTGKPYVVGDTVTQFAPLVTGVEVKDWVNDPKWFGGYLTQGSFYEVEKFFKFLVRVDSKAFNLNALLFSMSFVLRIKPTYTYPLFVVLAAIGNTEVVVTDGTVIEGSLFIDDGACFNGTLGAATMFDQARPAGGGWRSQFDHNADPTTPPTYPTPNYPIVWGFDKNYLCPEDAIVGTCCVTFVAPTLPTFDSIFAFDLPVYTLEAGLFAEGALAYIPAPPTGLTVGLPQTVGGPGTLNRVNLEINGSVVGSPATYNLLIKKNGVTAATIPFTLTPGDYLLSAVVAIAVLGGDILTAFIVPTGLVGVPVEWSGVLVTVGQAVSWAYDTNLAAGTYCVYKDL